MLLSLNVAYNISLNSMIEVGNVFIEFSIPTIELGDQLFKPLSVFLYTLSPDAVSVYVKTLDPKIMDL